MPRIHTHYDNLKVTRNAPPEVIRAAYKTLCQKFHPDRNPDNKSAEKTFLIIRSAYETLSNPEKRKRHDEWIASAESPDTVADVSPRHHRKAHGIRPANSQAVKLRRTRKRWQYGFWLFVTLLIVVGFFFN